MRSTHQSNGRPLLTKVAYSLERAQPLRRQRGDRAHERRYHSRSPVPPWTHYNHPGPALLSAQEAKDRLCEIVEGFVFRRLRTDDGGRVGRLLVKSPPGLGKTRQAIKSAVRCRAEQE